MTDQLNQFDETMMHRALELAAEAASNGEVPVGAIVYETETGVVLGQGRNTRENQREPWGHAEFLAVQEACHAIGDWRLNHCSLAVTLEPCPMCAGLLVNARLGRVVYGAKDDKRGGLDFSGKRAEGLFHPKTEMTGGVLEEECAEILQRFFARRRKS